MTEKDETNGPTELLQGRGGRERLLALRYAGLVLACVGLAIFHGLSLFDAGPCDDEFIVLRYARNLADGHGLVFNVGERVEGFSVPLWTLFMSWVHGFGGSAPAWSQGISLAGFAAVVALAGVVWRGLVPRAAWPVPSLILAASPALALHTSYGLGTLVLAACVLGWSAAYLADVRADRTAWRAAIPLAIGALIRHEVLLLALPFVLAERRRGFLPLAVATLPTAAWGVFRWSYFGELVPNTWFVKKLALSDDLELGLEYLASASVDLGLGAWIPLTIGVLVAAARSRTPWSRWVLVNAAGFLLHTAFVVSVGGDFMPLGRFFLPTLPIGVVLSSFAIERMLRAQPQRTALATGMIATGVALAVLSIPQTKREEWRALHRFQEDRWEAIGNQLAASWSRDTRLATAPIGAMGYFSGLPILDLLGLTHTAFRDVEPDMTVRMKGHHRYDAEWVLDQAPEAIVLGNGVLAPESNTLVVSRWEQTLFQHPRFAREYSPMVMPIEGSYPLYFFLSNAAFPPPGAKSIDLGSTRPEGNAAGSAPPR